MPVNVVLMELPHDRSWLWYEDLQILALAPGLDATARKRAVDEMIAEWGGRIRAAVAG